MNKPVATAELKPAVTTGPLALVAQDLCHA